MNKGRLLNKNLFNNNISVKVLNLLNKPSPYLIKDGERYKRTNINEPLKYIKYKIIVINSINNEEVIYESINEIIRTLKISRSKILSILDIGLAYKNYIFKRIK